MCAVSSVLLPTSQLFIRPCVCMCMWCVCVCIYIYIHTYIYTHTYIHTQVHTPWDQNHATNKTHTCPRAHTTQDRRRPLNELCNAFAAKLTYNIYIYIHIYMYVCIYIHTHTDKHTRIRNMYIHIICTHIHKIHTSGPKPPLKTSPTMLSVCSKTPL